MYLAKCTLTICHSPQGVLGRVDIMGHGLSFAEQERVNVWPGSGMFEWLGHDIRGILLTINEMESQNSGGDGFTDTVVGQGIPALGQGGMGKGGAGNDTLVVTK